MNQEHKDAIARQQIQNICKLYDGDVKFQKVYVPQGPGLDTKVRRRIIIEHDYDGEN